MFTFFNRCLTPGAPTKTTPRLAGSLVALSLVLGAGSSYAQVGGWLAANAALVSPADPRVDQTATAPIRQELFEATHTYIKSAAPALDLGGGIRFGKVGVGAAVSRYIDHHKGTIGISMPNPWWFNQPATDSGSTEQALAYRETVLHLEGRYLAEWRKVGIGVFAGPSYFIVTRQSIDSESFTEVINPATLTNSVVLSGYSSRIGKTRTWGYHAGLDASYYFKHAIGIGTLVRFSRATLPAPDERTQMVRSDQTAETAKAGGLSVGAGLHLRF